MLDYYLFKQVHDLYEQGRTQNARLILKELQAKYVETCDENALLKSQVQEYEDILYLAKNLEYDGFSYWLKTGNIKQGPFCQQCFDKDGLLIRLHEHEDAWKCLTCGVSFERLKEDVGIEQAPPAREHGHSGKVIQLYK